MCLLEFLHIFHHGCHGSTIHMPKKHKELNLISVKLRLEMMCCEFVHHVRLGATVALNYYKYALIDSSFS